MVSPESSPPPILRLLGGAVIQTGDAPLGGPAAHRHRLALLALLAVSGRPLSRDKLVAYLWPERDTEPARNLLKTAVHELRKLLGENAIRSTGDQLSIDPDALRCDVTEFEAAVRAKDYRAAAALYAGPFLDGFFLKEAKEFEDWTAGQRQRLEELHARVLETAPAQRLSPLGVARPEQSPPRAAPPPPAPAVPARLPLRGRPFATGATLLVLTVAAFVATAPANRAGELPKTIELAPDDPGSALILDGATGHASTPNGTLVTPKIDNIAWHAWLRYDGPNGRHQVLFYNGHGAVTGWGLMLVGPNNGVSEGTIGVLAGGISVTATPLVLKRGQWQRLTAERRDGKVVVTLDDESFDAGMIRVNPVAAARRDIERTSIGGDGSYDEPGGMFNGAIDRVRIRDIAATYWIEQWNFDEGAGRQTIGLKGGVLRVGKTAWGPGARLSARELFWSGAQWMCGQAYNGQVTERGPSDSAFAAGGIIIHAQSCTPREIRLALHLGADRSRTIVLTHRPDGALHLRHERRGVDGREDRQSGYGGVLRDSGSVARMEFVADAASIARVPALRGESWVFELTPGKFLAYTRKRADGTTLRIEFNPDKWVAVPPPPWGFSP